MSRFEVCSQAIDRQAFRDRLADRSCGACVLFEGWVRNHNEGQKVLRLEYEVYAPLAIKEGNRILDEAMERFSIENARAVHRSGLMELSEVAVLVGVSSAHRDAAFDACRYIIDQAKIRLPIWKKEHYQSGEAEWINCRHCYAAGHRHS